MKIIVHNFLTVHNLQILIWTHFNQNFKIKIDEKGFESQKNAPQIYSKKGKKQSKTVSDNWIKM